MSRSDGGRDRDRDRDHDRDHDRDRVTVTRRAFLADLVKGALVAGAAPILHAGCKTASSPGDPDSTVQDTRARDLVRSDWSGAKNATGYVYDARFLDHPHSTERPERLTAIQKRIEQSGLGAHLTSIQLLADPYPQIQRVHSEQHVASIKQLPTTGPVAALAAAGALGAVKAVCEGRVKNAFCAIRPPGHHATDTGREEGFCFYGNVAIAARYAQAALGLKRVLIVDWDYHHGNGTEWAFYGDPSVLFFSTHDQYAYPRTGDPARTGEGAGTGFNINVHLDCGSGDESFDKVFDDKLLPAASSFKPELVLISAGFDSKRNDQLGCFDITPCGFSRLTRKVMQLAEEHAKGRVVSLLEGGYADSDSSGAYTYNGLSSSVEAHVATLLSGDLYPSGC